MILRDRLKGVGLDALLALVLTVAGSVASASAARHDASTTNGRIAFTAIDVQSDGVLWT